MARAPHPNQNPRNSQPLTSAVDFEPVAVDKNVNASRKGVTIPRVRRSTCPCPCPPAQRRVIGHGDIQLHQLSTDARKPLVWRSRRPNTSPNVRAVSIARSE